MNRFKKDFLLILFFFPRQSERQDDSDLSLPAILCTVVIYKRGQGVQMDLAELRAEAAYLEVIQSKKGDISYYESHIRYSARCAASKKNPKKLQSLKDYCKKCIVTCQSDLLLAPPNLFPSD